MKKLGKMHCFIRIKPTGEQVKMQRNLAHWGSWDTVNLTDMGQNMLEKISRFILIHKADLD